MDAELIVRLVVTLVAFILSCTVHEWAHAFTATRLGDPTPRGDGRRRTRKQGIAMRKFWLVCSKQAAGVLSSS